MFFTGKKYLYDGQMPYEPSQMQLGMSPIEIQRLFQLGGEWYVSGENFSPYCRVMSGSPAAGYRIPVCPAAQDHGGPGDGECKGSVDPGGG